MHRPRIRRPTGWAALVPVAGALAGLLLAASAVTANGTDLRSSRTLQLSQLVRERQRQVAELTGTEQRLQREIAAATVLAGAGDARVDSARAEADRLAGVAGLDPVTGPAVTVTLTDAPRSRQQSQYVGGPSPDDLVVHQQDVQAVVNALWAGGAEAMTLMGQRVISTTAVRCVGNTLLLQGAVYSPPYRVTAIGDVRRLQAALDAAPGVQIYREYVAAYGLGYDVKVSRSVRLPGYDGPLDLREAKVGT